MTTGRIILGGLYLLLSTLLSAQQEVLPIVDMCVHSTGKIFNSDDPMKASLWTKKSHSCEVNPDNPIFKALKEVPKYSQSNFEEMIKGNVRLSNQFLTTLELPFIRSKYLESKDALALVNCISGYELSPSSLERNEIDYFKEIVAQIRFLKNKQFESHEFGPWQYRFKLLKNRESLSEIPKDKTKLGLILSLKGGHTLGHSLYLTNKMTETIEYENMVLKNIDRLKGILPLSDHSTDFLEAPIFSFSFDSYFPDGLCGKNLTFNAEEQKVFGGAESIDKPLTPLGEKVIKKCISNKDAPRILIDVCGMPPKARAWYYDYLKSMRYMGDTIPIIASHAVINGNNWNDPHYDQPDAPEKNKNSYFSNYKSALTKQDIQNVAKSEGLICLTLNSRRLIQHTVFATELQKIVPGSQQEREVVIKALVANICKIIHIVQSVDAWNFVAISSEFDELSVPLPGYTTSSDFNQLAKDLKNFLANPKDIYNIYTAKQIKGYMYDYTPEELVNKILSQNAYLFIQKHFAKKPHTDNATANEK